MGLRKSAADLTDAERTAFIDALLAVKASGRYDDLVRFHYRQMPDGMPPMRMPAHRSPGFLPWHRRFLRELETALEQARPGVALPYWDWADPRSIPAIFSPSFLGGRAPSTDGSRFTASAWPLRVRRPGEANVLERDLVGMETPGAIVIGPDEIDAVLGRDAYDAPAYDHLTRTGFRAGLERLHDMVHGWVGGSMNAGTSPNDPVFYLHHAQVDRLWAQWMQGRGPTGGYVTSTGVPIGYRIDDPMQPWGDEPPRAWLDHESRGWEYPGIAGPGGSTPTPAPIVELVVGGMPHAAALTAPGQVHRYRFVVATAGEFVMQTAGTTDVVMTLLDATQTALAESDDIAPDDLNARIVRSLSPGDYGLSVRGFGTTTGAYSIAVRRGPAGGPPTGAPAGTPVLVNGPALAGAIGVAGERDVFHFTAPALGAYRIETAGPTDTVLRLFGPDSTATLLAENDDAAPGRLTSSIARDLAAGAYHVEVSGYRDTVGPFTLAVRRSV